MHKQRQQRRLLIHQGALMGLTSWHDLAGADLICRGVLRTHCCLTVELSMVHVVVLPGWTVGDTLVDEVA
jgi:hypothetical protein